MRARRNDRILLNDHSCRTKGALHRVYCGHLILRHKMHKDGRLYQRVAAFHQHRRLLVLTSSNFFFGDFASPRQGGPHAHWPDLNFNCPYSPIAIARQAGIGEFHAALLPEDKVRVLKSLKTIGPVAMVAMESMTHLRSPLRRSASR